MEDLCEVKKVLLRLQLLLLLEVLIVICLTYMSSNLLANLMGDEVAVLVCVMNALMGDFLLTMRMEERSYDNLPCCHCVCLLRVNLVWFRFDLVYQWPPLMIFLKVFHGQLMLIYHSLVLLIVAVILLI